MIFCEDPTDGPAAESVEYHLTLRLRILQRICSRREWLDALYAAVQHEEDRFGPQVRLVQG